MDRREFQRLAGELAEAQDAASLRTALSRAYYAAYHAVAELLEAAGHPLPSTADAHREAPDLLRGTRVQDLRSLSHRLHNLRLQRNHADYDLLHRDSERQKTVKTWVTEARSLTAAVERHLDPQHLEQLRRALL